MKLSQKMILIFSIVMISAVAILTSYTTRTSLRSSEAFTAARFENMGTTISKALEQELAMMELTIEELLDNASFMAALNQYVRDDSEDQKMATAARNTIIQQLYRSPMVENFYRVTFFTRDGSFVSSRVEKDDCLESGTDKARELFNAIPWLDELDAAPNRCFIHQPHNDFLSVRRDFVVYGVARAVQFHSKNIGYIEVTSEIAGLKEIMSQVDETTIMTQAVFSDGTVLYSSSGLDVIYPLDLARNTLIDYKDDTGLHHQVMRVYNEWLDLHVFIAQDQSISAQRTRTLYLASIRTAVLITGPALVLFVFIALRLTDSIRRLTKKVRQLPVESALEDSSNVTDILHHTVTRTGDAELHELEKVFNSMMLRLRESTINELSMREGTLQAQLSALQTQINPHFIYNTLNMISSKSLESGNMEVIDICDHFAQMLRYAIDTQSQTATLAEEIENARDYLHLAKSRYEQYLEFTINVPAQLEQIIIPKLSLQPIVENAMIHGYNGRNTVRVLSITGWLENDLLILEIHDNGTGFSPESLAALQQRFHDIEDGTVTISQTGKHIGLVNTYLRLFYYSHKRIRISLRNAEGAVVRLTIPVADASLKTE